LKDTPQHQNDGEVMKSSSESGGMVNTQVMMIVDPIVVLSKM
jgi:hypothetical protein